MKTLTLAVTLACLLPLSIPTDTQSHYYSRYSRHDSDIYWHVDVDFFYDYLEPYGDWVYSSDFGWLWMPYEVPAGWCPYTRGHWIYSPYGWTWVSDFSWGWAPFHYGRWVMTDYHGWCWIPGSTWAPAWVSWRWSGVHVGWAPLPPWYDYNEWGIYSPTIEINIWIFVDWDHFCDRQVWRRCVHRDRVRDVYRDTDESRHLWNDRNRDRFGPEREMVEKKTHMSVTERRELRIDGIRPPSEFKEQVRRLDHGRNTRPPNGWEDARVRERPTGRVDEPGRPARVFKRPSTDRDHRFYSRPDVTRQPQVKRKYSVSRPKASPGNTDRKQYVKPKVKIKKAAPKSEDKKAPKIQKSKKVPQKVKKSDATRDKTRKLNKVRISR